MVVDVVHDFRVVTAVIAALVIAGGRTLAADDVPKVGVGLNGPGGSRQLEDYSRPTRAVNNASNKVVSIYIQRVYPPITYYWTVPLILDPSYLVENLTSSKIADTKVSGFSRL
jgi:hypothetical protein